MIKRLLAGILSIFVTVSIFADISFAIGGDYRLGNTGAGKQHDLPYDIFSPFPTSVFFASADIDVGIIVNNRWGFYINAVIYNQISTWTEKKIDLYSMYPIRLAVGYNLPLYKEKYFSAGFLFKAGAGLIYFSSFSYDLNTILPISSNWSFMPGFSIFAEIAPKFGMDVLYLELPIGYELNAAFVYPSYVLMEGHNIYVGVRLMIEIPIIEEKAY
ncbi:hypothetical protein WKV44_07560 [Spirochaetia bacterium 38H-sp]|uniref:Outer membrane protein beta-barrel domain-containing protein n=1 Tax=Rarispira pelagica TaxID=3141764 RepID=A0ABU9UCK7_9SPIR